MFATLAVLLTPAAIAVALAVTPMQVLLVTPLMDSSAMSVEIVQLAQALQSASWHVEMLALAGASTAAATAAAHIQLIVAQPFSHRFCLNISSHVGGASAAAEAVMLVDPLAYDVILAQGAALDHAPGGLWMREQVEAFGPAFLQRLVWWIHELPSEFRLHDPHFQMLAHEMRKNIVFSSECVASMWRRALEHHIKDCGAEFRFPASAAETKHWHVIYPTVSYTGTVSPAEQRQAMRAAARQLLDIAADDYVIMFVKSASSHEGVQQVIHAVDRACAKSLALTSGNHRRHGGSNISSNTSSGSASGSNAGGERSLREVSATKAPSGTCPLLLYAFSAEAMGLSQLRAKVASTLRWLPIGRVRFIEVGNASADMLAQLHAAANLYVANPRCCDFGAPTLQAMAAGLPVVGCACSSTADEEESQPLSYGFNGDVVSHLEGHITRMDPRSPDGPMLADRAAAVGETLLHGKFAPRRQLAAWEALLGSVSSSSRQYDNAMAMCNGPTLPYGVGGHRGAAALILDMPSARVLARLGGLLSRSSGEAAHAVPGQVATATTAAAATASRTAAPEGSSRSDVQLWRAPVTWRWRRFPDAPFACVEGVGTVVGRWLYVWGGYVTIEVMNNVMRRLDMSDGSWTDVKTPLPADMPLSHTATAVHLERYIYVVGGPARGACYPPTNASYRFDTVTEQWQPLLSPPMLVFGGKGAIVGNVLHIVRATSTRDAQQGIADLSLVLPVDGTMPAGPWRQTPAGAFLTWHSMVTTINVSGKPTIVEFGGGMKDMWPADSANKDYNCKAQHHDEVAVTYGMRTLVQRRDPVTGAESETWEHESNITFPMGLSHAEACTIVVPGDRIVIFLGGCRSCSWMSRTIYAYHTRSRRITTVGMLPQGRVKGGVCGLWNGSLWMAGGQQSSLNAQGCLLSSGAHKVLPEVWMTPLPPELLVEA